MSDPARIGRITVALQTLWAAHPHLSFGHMIEKVEDEAWVQFVKSMNVRSCTARWMNLPDIFLEAALVEIAKRGTL